MFVYLHIGYTNYSIILFISRNEANNRIKISGVVLKLRGYTAEHEKRIYVVLNRFGYNVCTSWVLVV